MSLALLSQPRGGTQFCEDILGKVYLLSGGITISIGKFLFWYDSDLVPKVMDEQWVSNNLETKGYFFGNLGPFPDVQKMPRLKYLVMCRDPRDVLISLYYSIRDAHVPNSYKMIEYSRAVQSMSLEDYFANKEIQKNVLEFTKQAVEMIRSDHNFLFYRYEDMMNEPDRFVAEIASFIGVELEENVRLDLVNSFNVGASDGEVSHRHRRSGRWGQYLEKISPEARGIFWKDHGDLLELLGYGENGLLPPKEDSSGRR